MLVWTKSMEIVVGMAGVPMVVSRTAISLQGAARLFPSGIGSFGT
jgi:hypothetical protein